MVASIKKMWVSCAATLCLVAAASAAGGSNGYNYDQPSVPFPPIPAPNQQPTPTPYRPPQPRPTPARPTYIPPPTQPHEHEHHEHHEDHHHHEPGMPFDFSYAVEEDGNNYSHNAISDGDVTRGEYRVALPDGRTQIVKYTADWKNGFNAEVSYEGEAQYPEQPVGGYNKGGQAYLPPSQGGGYQY